MSTKALMVVTGLVALVAGFAIGRAVADWGPFSPQMFEALGTWLGGIATLVAIVWAVHTFKVDRTRRVVVGASTTTMGYGLSDGSIANEMYVVVSVKAEAGPIGLDRVDLILQPPGSTRAVHTVPAIQRYHQVSRSPRAGIPPELDKSLVGWDWSPMNMHRVLETGEKCVFVFSVTVESDDPEPKLRDFVAVATLTNGGEVKSNVVQIFPGWIDKEGKHRSWKVDELPTPPW